MNRSRRREFGEFRTHSSSVNSQTASMRSSKLSQSTISEACVNCVNIIMAERQKKTQKQEKQKTRAEFRKNYQTLNQWIDPQTVMRQSMKRDALNYNSRLIQAQKQAKKYEKQQDIKYATNVQKTILEAQQIMKQQFEEEKQKKDQYYNEIHTQYVSQLQKKDQEKYQKHKSKEKDGGLPLFNPDTTQQKLQYKKELERQMEEKRAREFQEKINSQLKEKQLLDEYNAQAQKYHADSYEAMTMSRQQVFDGLKNLQVSRKKKAEQTRKANDNQRMQLIKQQNEQRSRAIKLKMREMQNYVQGLKKQLLQKQERLRSSKREDMNFMESLHKSTEEIHAEMEVKKTCKGCHKDYPQEYIGPVPKKVA